MGKPVEEPEKEKDIFPFHAKTQEECFAELKCGPNHLQTGLTSEEAAQRLEKYGQNKLSEKEKVTLLQRIWKQVGNILVGILAFVAVISAVRAGTSTNSEDIVTNSIQVGIIVGVIT